jgi:pyruvate formate lyase activating enzyme
MTGLVTDIQRFSIHDGPGIRTTVFFKGCLLRCLWCHNPETMAAGRQVQFFPSRCIGCGRCVVVCRNDGHKLLDGKHAIDRSRCVVCGACTSQCCAEALVMAGKEMTLEQVAAEVAADKPFYRNSGGGATLSGGEPLCQRDFALELVKLLKADGIHTAIETALACSWSHALPVLERVDMVLLDLKLMDDAQHRKWTGVGNRQILENATRLARLPPRLVVRTPVVPGVNDRPEEIAAIAKFVAALGNVEYYELLPYHRLGSGKYESLGLTAPMGDVPPPPADTIAALAAAAAACGLRVRASGQEYG